MMADTDVAVIGAGLAGLTAAAELAGRGHRVAVIEATERSGGRIATHAFGDVALDEGGAYVGPRHTAVRELAERNGVGLTPTEVPGDSLFDLRGTITRSPGPPPLNALALGDLLDRLEGLAEEVCLGCPAATAGAGRLDTLTVASWAAEQRLHPDARLALTLIVREMLAVEPTDVSLLHLLYYTRSGGGICYLTAFSGGAQQDRFTGGAARLTSQLTARLRVPPVLGAPVRSVSAGQDRVCLAGDDVRLTARHVLITVPSGTAEPLLVYGPGPISAGQRRVRGSAIKVHVIYPEPFWRAVGLSGWITSDSGPAGFFVDDAAWSAGPGVLTGFITGDAAGAYRGSSPGDRRAAVLTRLARWLGPAAAQPLRYCEHDWLARPFTPGCYGAVPTPGAWSTEQPLAAPGTRLHWAGSERSAEFYGHMEGAVRSGLRAADVIDSALRRQSRAGITY